ncbi:MAG: 1-deoxy-D-xylulose-5-phosphate reductoisomerase [Firmicutes bacterium]|nr:1-deoxy-D-xylulose-5-phosphate reductoisomerase [Bacillota bacterium]
MKKRIVVLGSTGSIGTQSLDVIRKEKENLELIALAAYGNRPQLFAEQILEFSPLVICVYEEKNLPLVQDALSSLAGSPDQYQWTVGMPGLIELATLPEADLIVTSLVGMIGIVPTVEAIRAHKDIALANKETLACAGRYIMKLAEENKIRILPVDSEHGAIFQCMEGVRREDVRKIWLTASGGPFRGYSKEQLKTVTLEQALKHPNWGMGAKITIDSATLMNKGTEMIEAKWLYGMEPENVCPVIHPQSIIHSMIEMKDGSVLAQLGPVDMRLPIEVMLMYPERGRALMEPLDFTKLGPLTFEAIDEDAFPSIRMARESMQMDGLFPACYTAANELAVEQFRQGKIGFTDIFRLVDHALERLSREAYHGTSYEIEEVIRMPERVKAYCKDIV